MLTFILYIKTLTQYKMFHIVAVLSIKAFIYNGYNATFNSHIQCGW